MPEFKLVVNAALNISMAIVFKSVLSLVDCYFVGTDEWTRILGHIKGN